MSGPATSLAFFDPARQVSGSVRAGLGVVFEAGGHQVTSDPPDIEADGGGWTVALGERSRLRFEAVGPEIGVDEVQAQVCHVAGRLVESRVDCLGIAATLAGPPAWSELDATRSIVAVFGRRDALVVHARRPRGAVSHGQEAVAAALCEHGEVRGVEDVRLSTVYDGEGRQRTANVELWLPGEDFPRRASGVCTAGMSLALEGLDVHLGMFTWRMEAREGVGSYELTVRADREEAA